MAEEELTFLVERYEAGLRLDRFLALKVDRLSRSRLANFIRKKEVEVNGVFQKPGYLVKEKDEIRLRLKEEESSGLIPEEIDLSIIHEDSSIVVINKPPGLVVHPSFGHSSGTLVNALIYHFPDLDPADPARPGIVHRLDKDTSGIIVVAKDPVSHYRLAGQFAARKVKKEYLAIVVGNPSEDSGTIELAMGRDPVERKKISSRARKKRDAVTAWRVVERWNGLSLLLLRPLTGRTHQIRVHCAETGMPILGDRLYGKTRSLKGLKREGHEIAAMVKRQMLHASRISFIHPGTEEAVSYEAPLPEDMDKTITALRGLSQRKRLAGIRS